MKFSSDLTIGQRLGVAFGLYLLMLAAILMTFVSWHNAAAQVQREYAERIIPVRDLLHAAETSIYVTGIAVRSVLLEPSQASVIAFDQAAARSKLAFQRLDEAIDVPVERKLHDALAQDVAEYLSAADSLVRLGTTGNDLPDKELQLGALRERLMAHAGRLGAAQSQRAAANLNEISKVRARTSKGLQVLTLLSVLVVGLLAWLVERSISMPARILLGRVAALESGDWKPILQLASRGQVQPKRDELAKLSAAFGSAAVALERREQRVMADNRLATAVVKAADQSALAHSGLDCIVAHLGVELGIFYLSAQRSAVLVAAAQFGIGGSLALVEPGDGLPGEVAKSRRSRILSDIPADCGLQIKLGYDQALPKAVVAVPIVFREHVHGVILLASLRPIDAHELAYLEASALQLGIGLQNLRAFEEVQQLFSEVRVKNENIQSQNEELQAQNEEIQAQHEEIQAQNEELMQQSEDLRSHSAQLADVDDRKNAFLGVLAHELRNPMAPIVNGLHILKLSPPGSEPALTAQAIIERQTTHLVRLIDDLLDITRISEGKVNLDRERLDLIKLARQCVEDVKAGFEQSRIGLQLVFPEQAIFVEGDHTRLCQILGNLLNNSLKFCEPGSRVSLTVEKLGDSAVLSVVDDGIGIDAQLLPHVFEPFSQGSAGLARTKGGLGLGLALVKVLVELHRGEVRAYSDGPGRGARFTVSLPMSVDQASAPEATRVDTGRNASSYRLLIIEDHLDAATTLRDALQMEGFQVQVVHSAKAGIAAVREQPPDVVLCDIGLPDLDGYAVARALRSDPKLSATVLIALTGYASAGDRRLAEDAGFHHHLAKPLRIAELSEAISRLRTSPTAA